MEKNKGFTDNLQKIEQLVTAFCKHEILLEVPPMNKLRKCDIKAQRRAYRAMAKELQLPNVTSVKSHIQSLKKHALIKMRECVRLSINRGRIGIRDALTYAPDWLKKLDELLNLVEKAVKVEYRVGRRPSPLAWELLRCAERAARRARSPRAAARALGGADCFRDYALALQLDLDRVHAIWIRCYCRAVRKLKDLINFGDRSEKLGPSKRFTLQDWRVADVGLLYDFRLRIVTEPSFNHAMTLYPMIMLFKLMVAAKEKIDQREAAQLKLNEAHTGRQNMHSGDRPGTKGSTHNIIQTNTPLFRHYSENIVSTSQITMDVSEDESSLRKENINKKPCNEYETAEIWALVHSKYTNCGRSASAVLLQKRWYEMKRQTRTLLVGGKSVPLLLAMGKRFPFILTETLPSWRELVRNEQVFMDSDLEPYKIEFHNMDLDLPDIDENVLLDEINDWNDDGVEIINENRELITVTTSDDEQTNDNINNESKTTDLPTDNDVTREETNVEIEDDSCIKKLESLDPESAKVKIIFEDESDSDLNEYLNSSEKNYRNEYDSKYDTDENNTIKSETIEQSGDMKTELEATLESNYTLTGNIPNYAFNSSSDDKLYDLQTTSPKNEPNSLSVEDPDNTIKSEFIEQSGDMKTELEDTFESNDILNGDVPKRHIADTNCANDEAISNGQLPKDESESLDTSVENEIDDSNKESTFVDPKLVRRAHVILKPLEEIDEWRKLSKLDSINCRRFSVRNFAKPLQLTSKQLSNCRPLQLTSKQSSYFVPIRVKRNGISSRKNLEMQQMPNILKKRKSFLTKYLKLPWTYFSLKFWNERNIGLLELCKPVSVKLEMLSRVVKKVELTDIDEVRRINKTILTAQVAPVTDGRNRTFVINSSMKSPATLSQTLVQPALVQPILVQPAVVQPKLVQPADTSLISENQESDDAPTINSAFNVKLPNETEVRKSIKKVVRNGVVAKTPEPVYIRPQKIDAEFKCKQRSLDKDIRKTSARMSKQHEKVMEKKKKRERAAYIPKELKLDPNINCSQEWQRQKSQNLIYFNFKPAPNGHTDTDQNKPENKNNHNTKKRHKKNKKRKEHKPEANKTRLNEKVNEIKSIVKAANDVAKDLELNDSTFVNFCTSSDSDSETDRLVINLDNTTDEHLKRKSVDKQSDIMCKIAKTSARMSKQHEKVMEKKKKRERAAYIPKELKLDPNINCSQEWQRQKSQNLIYFNFKPAPDGHTDTDQNKPENKNNHNTKKRHKKNKTRKEHKPEANKTRLNEKVNEIKSIVKAANDVAKDLELNDSSATFVNFCISSDSESEIDRLVINLDNTTDEHLKRKSVDKQSDFMCKIAKTDSNDITIVNNTKNIVLQPNIMCHIANTDLFATTIVNNTKNIARQSNILNKIAKTDANAINIVNNTNNCVIDCCDDSNDNTAIDTLENVADDENLNVHNSKATNNESTPQIKNKIIKNKIEINGDCKSQIVEEKSEEVLTFLSKVAGRIQKNNMTKPLAPATTPAANNSTVYYVIKSVDKNKQTNETSEQNTSNATFTETITNTTMYTQTMNTNSNAVQDDNVSVTANSASTFFVIKIPDLQSGAATSYMSPLPGFAPQVPIIQSVPAVTQTPQQIQESLTNLPTYPNNFGEVIDTTYANQLYSLTSMPMQRNNSLPMPITSVTAWPTQNDSNQEPLIMEWQKTNPNQVIYPVTVTSGSSRSEIIKDVNEVSLSSAPWNKTKQSDVTVMPVTSITSDSSQVNRRLVHIQPKRTYPAKKSTYDNRQMFINDTLS